MTETTNLGLPLVQAAQAQKHVTVNEAMTRLDAVVQLTLSELDAVTPPTAPNDGTGYALGAAPTGEWSGQGGQVALSLDGSWHFVTPSFGWRAWDATAGVVRQFDGVQWREADVVNSVSGAVTRHGVIEFDQVLGGGGPVSTDVSIPANAQVIGITGRVIDPVAGPDLTGWELGVDGSSNRYGSGLGMALNSWVRGLTGQPVTYYVDTPLLLSPIGGASFTGGTVRFAIHLTQLEPPRAI